MAVVGVATLLFYFYSRDAVICGTVDAVRLLRVFVCGSIVSMHLEFNSVCSVGDQTPTTFFFFFSFRVHPRCVLFAFRLRLSRVSRKDQFILVFFPVLRRSQRITTDRFGHRENARPVAQQELNVHFSRLLADSIQQMHQCILPLHVVAFYSLFISIDFTFSSLLCAMSGYLFFFIYFYFSLFNFITIVCLRLGNSFACYSHLKMHCPIEFIP